jgi:hypothetical protein
MGAAARRQRMSLCAEPDDRRLYKKTFWHISSDRMITLDLIEA